MFEGGAQDKADMKKLQQASDQAFYDRLLEFFTERGQPITNSTWQADHNFQATRGCFARLCCRNQGARERIGVSAELLKPLWFTDETIQLNINIDNSNSQKGIDEIDVTLR